MTPTEEAKGTVHTSRPSFVLPDVLTVEVVRRRLENICTSERITSNEAQWLARAAGILEVFEDELRRTQKP